MNNEPRYLTGSLVIRQYCGIYQSYAALIEMEIENEQTN